MKNSVQTTSNILILICLLLTIPITAAAMRLPTVCPAWTQTELDRVYESLSSLGIVTTAGMIQTQENVKISNPGAHRIIDEQLVTFTVDSITNTGLGLLDGVYLFYRSVETESNHGVKEARIAVGLWTNPPNFTTKVTATGEWYEFLFSFTRDMSGKETKKCIEEIEENSFPD